MRKRTQTQLGISSGTLLLTAAIALALGGCQSTPAPQNTPTQSRQPASSAATPTAALPDQQGAPLLPDPKMTPGAVLPVTKDDICVPGYAHKVRNVPIAVKRQAYAEYGILSHRPGDFEVDHLISLELGGSNSLKNLWPESFRTQPWNARVKDQLENKLHDMVCSGQLDLPTAQHEIATDWIAAYKKYFKTQAPLASYHSPRHGSAAPDSSGSPAANAQTPPTSANGQVWVNLNSGKYWRPGTQYYGKTKHGAYMSEQNAIKQGYTAVQRQ